MEKLVTATPQQIELSQNENQVKVEAMETLSFINNPQDAVIELRLQGESVNEVVRYIFCIGDVGNIVQQVMHVLQAASLEVYKETGEIPFRYRVDNIF